MKCSMKTCFSLLGQPKPLPKFSENRRLILMYLPPFWTLTVFEDFQVPWRCYCPQLQFHFHGDTWPPQQERYRFTQGKVISTLFVLSSFRLQVMPRRLMPDHAHEHRLTSAIFMLVKMGHTITITTTTTTTISGVKNVVSAIKDVRAKIF